MQYRRLGKSGVKVSSIGLGSWLTYGRSVADAGAEACIKAAYEAGVNFFDTANAYNNGEAEITVGKTLRAYPRASYVLATKVYFPMGNGPNDRGLSRKHIIEQCHHSLRRLGVETIDLYQCHRYDSTVPLDETLRALDDLIRQGKVLYAGVSEWSAVQIRDALHRADALGIDRIVSNQPIYNMFVRYIEKEILPLCEQEGIGQVVFSPLAQGILTGKYHQNQAAPAGSRGADPKSNHWIEKYLQNDIFTTLEALTAVAQDINLTLPQLALAWVLRKPIISAAIIGASRPEQVLENIKAADVKLSQEVIDRVEQILAPLEVKTEW